MFSPDRLESHICVRERPLSNSFYVSGAVGLGSRLNALSVWLLSFGAVGLFGISLLDSALIPLPSGPDLAMIALSAANHSGMLVYALVATAGSTIGCTVLYRIARGAGAQALKKINPRRRERIENLLGKYDMLAVFVPAILPPPFPFKAFVLSAGVFKLKTGRFIAAIFCGRFVRFLIEGWLAVRFGDDARKIIAENGLKVLTATCIIAAAIVVTMILRRRRPSRQEPVETVERASPGSA